MRFLSTGGAAPPVGLEEALLGGLAPDGGLYLPEEIVPFEPREIDRLLRLSFPEIACRVAQQLLQNSALESELESITRDAFDFPLPLVEVSPGCHALELFWGPTLAFKDVGAQFMAQLLRRVLDEREREPITILAATSGDTGSAVARAFFGLDGFRAVVLYPKDQVSEAQRKLFTTLGGNVVAVEVAGTFDDCQRLVKGAFSDRSLRSEVPLAAANSINVGRLLPQTFYYFHAVAQLPSQLRRPLVIATPSGNFGNLTAGLIAKRLGLEASRFVAATNRNDVVPRYLETGCFQPRPSLRTPSNAMDVGDPSNLVRIQRLYRDDLDALRADVAGHAFDDETTLSAITEVHAETGYVLDPHSAVGYLGLHRELARSSPGATGIFLATAHPAKFVDVVEPAIGRRLEMPPALARCLELEETIERIPVDQERLAEILRS